ncbi:MAG TPA: formylglycine-generating enzyme family protein, partial [Longimicrobiales bacterium]|nr:formylglycine-generating enzyme family protein [Longimicrobiales bacterium]
IPGTLVTFELIHVAGATVTMPDSTTVKVEPFYIGRTEVTWDMYDAFVLGLERPPARGADAIARPSEPYGAPDYGWGHAGYPVISVAHTAAQAFCRWLSTVTGKRYRLPTEAEWLLAARYAAGSAQLTPERLDALAWHRENAGAQTHPVGRKQPDHLGVFDLFGNAAEWVLVADGKPVVRGGSFRDPRSAVGPSAHAVQTAAWNQRDPQNPKSTWWLSDAPFAGFRIVRDPDPAR